MLCRLIEAPNLTSNRREAEMKACMEAEKAGSGEKAPKLLLLKEEGELMETRMCTVEKCFVK